MTGVFSFATKQDTTVTTASVLINDHRVIETAVIPLDEAEKHMKENTKNSEYSEYNPLIFKMDIANISSSDDIKFGFSYFEPVDWDIRSNEYNFGFFMPSYSTLSSQALQSGTFSLTANINGGGVPLSWRCASHSLSVVAQRFDAVQLAFRGPSSSISSFNLSYQQQPVQHIQTTALFQTEDRNIGQSNSFVLFLTPPAATSQPIFRRSVVFLLDISGSMSGGPLDKAKQALCTALKNLAPADSFTIVAFDDQLEIFSENLVEVSLVNVDSIGGSGGGGGGGENVSRACAWVNNLNARGGTDIMSPLNWALRKLSANGGASSQPCIPSVFLITDGAVQNEQEICHKLQEFNQEQSSRSQMIRVHTFGIGKYCNAYFLKMLASLGRGVHDISYDSSDDVGARITKFLLAVQSPILVDIEIALPASTDVEIYPFPIPDLFLGQPLAVSGLFALANANELPREIYVKGILPNGEVWQVSVPALAGQGVPITKMFVRQKLDILVGKAWLSGKTKDKTAAVDYSVQESVPCPYTRMVVYETTVEKKQEQAKKKKSSSSTGEKVAIGALALGGVALIGFAAMNFGDVASTAGNVASFIGGNLADIPNVFGDGGGCLDCCKCFDCFGNGCDALGGICCNCGNVLNCCGDAAGDVFGFCGQCFSCFCNDSICKFFSSCGGDCVSLGGNCMEFLCHGGVDCLKVVCNEDFCKCIGQVVCGILEGLG